MEFPSIENEQIITPAMKKTCQLIPVVLAMLFFGCTKEEEVQSTTFEGMVQMGNTDIPFSDVRLEVYGEARKYGCYLFCDVITKFNKVFPVASDGSFSIPVTTEEVDYFRLGIRINGERVSSGCAPLSKYNDLDAGKDYAGLIITYVE
jgi:hypothetical protein